MSICFYLLTPVSSSLSLKSVLRLDFVKGKKEAGSGWVISQQGANGIVLARAHPFTNETACVGNDFYKPSFLIKLLISAWKLLRKQLMESLIKCMRLLV